MASNNTYSDEMMLRVREQVRTLKQELRRYKNQLNEPVAIVGMGCRFPGSINNLDDYWELLQQGKSGIIDIPKGRWKHQDLYSPDPAALGKYYVERGGFLENIEGFDNALFNISEREARSMDPQQRILLQLVYETLDTWGHNPSKMSGYNAGVFVGLSTNDYASKHLYNNHYENIDVYSFTGVSGSTASGRISYSLGLEGPSISIDTACSSSLVGLHTAIQSLRNEDCQMAIVAGVNIISSPNNLIYFSKANALSKRSECRPFDRQADGYVRSEGCGVILLKRLSQAQLDGDTILSTVVGTSVNQDGKSQGLTAPRGPAQTKVIERALKQAKVKPKDINYIETHGTGTPLGDPIEFRAIGEVFKVGKSKDEPLYLGTVKANIGHLEAAAGLASLIKAVLVACHRELPPNINFTDPNPSCQWNEYPLRISKTSVDLPKEEDLHIGVSAFGISGTNCHVIIKNNNDFLPEELRKPTFHFKDKHFWLDDPTIAPRPGMGNEGLTQIYLPETITYHVDCDDSKCPYIAGHRVNGVCFMPAAGYIDLILTYVKCFYPVNKLKLENLAYATPLVFSTGEKKLLALKFRKSASKVSVKIYHNDVEIVSAELAIDGRIMPLSSIEIEQYSKIFEKSYGKRRFL